MSGKSILNDKRHLYINDSWGNAFYNMKNELRLQNKSYRTEKSYMFWVNDFSNFAGRKTPESVSETDVKQFLTYLAVERGIARSTQKHLNVNTQVQEKSGPGSGSFLHQELQLTPGKRLLEDIICIQVPSSVLLGVQLKRLKFRRMHQFIPFVIVLLPTSLKMAMTFEQCRNSLATQRFPPR